MTADDLPRWIETIHTLPGQIEQNIEPKAFEACFFHQLIHFEERSSFTPMPPGRAIHRGSPAMPAYKPRLQSQVLSLGSLTPHQCILLLLQITLATT